MQSKVTRPKLLVEKNKSLIEKQLALTSCFGKG